jgi:hypothetical protein
MNPLPDTRPQQVTPLPLHSVHPQDDAAAHMTRGRKQRTVNPLVVPSHYNFLTAGQPMWDASTADAANACLQRIMAHGAGMAPIGSAAQGWYRAAA